jgi:hypothetical protein
MARVLRTDIEVVDLPHDEQPWDPDDDASDLFGAGVDEER